MFISPYVVGGAVVLLAEFVAVIVYVLWFAHKERKDRRNRE